MSLSYLKAAARMTKGRDYEPLRVNNNILIIDDDNEDIRLALQTFPIPKITLGEIEVGYMNEKRKFVGLPTFEDITIVFADYVDKGIAKWCAEWMKQGYDWETGAAGMATAYKRSGRIIQFSPDGESHTREYELIGMKPTNFDPGDADLTGEDYHRINLTVSVDKALPMLEKW